MTTPVPAANIRRAHQRAAVQALHRVEQATVTELMQATGLSRPTVHTVCDDLVEARLVLEVDAATTENARGRRPRAFRLDNRAAHVVGVDAGATSVRAELTDLRGAPLGTATVRDLTLATTAAERLQAIRQCVTQAIADGGVRPADVRAVGIGLPAPVGHDNRVTALPGYLKDLPEADIAAEISGPDGWRVLLENDANLAVLAETRDGATQGLDDVVALLAGERLGAGVLLSGRLVRGATGAAGELSFAPLIRGVEGTEGIGLRARAAGVRALQDEPGRAGDALRSRCAGEPAALTSEDVFDAAAAGDPLARAALSQAVEPIARLISVVQLLLDPAAIVISGAVADAPGVVDSIQHQLPNLDEHTLHPARLLASTLGGRAVTVGATSMAIEDVWRQLWADPRLLVDDSAAVPG